jgi:putative effector of murein hydrolase LrgA (UPF0299 family)
MTRLLPLVVPPSLAHSLLLLLCCCDSLYMLYSIQHTWNCLLRWMLMMLLLTYC